jgi:hypothetical protein
LYASNCLAARLSAYSSEPGIASVVVCVVSEAAVVVVSDCDVVGFVSVVGVVSESELIVEVADLTGAVASFEFGFVSGDAF